MSLIRQVRVALSCKIPLLKISLVAAALLPFAVFLSEARANVIYAGDGGDSLNIVNTVTGTQVCRLGVNAGWINGNPENLYCKLGDYYDPRIANRYEGALELVEVNKGTPSDVIEWFVGTTAKSGIVVYLKVVLLSDPGFVGNGGPNKDDESKYYTPTDISAQIFTFLPPNMSARLKVLVSSDPDLPTPEPSSVVLAITGAVGVLPLLRNKRRR